MTEQELNAKIRDIAANVAAKNRTTFRDEYTRLNKLIRDVDKTLSKTSSYEERRLVLSRLF